MTDTSHTRRTTEPAPSYATTPATGVSGWTGWVVFAGIMLIMLGAFQVIEGLVALFDEGYYLVASSGLVLHVDYNVWGWVHLVIGVLAVATGLGLLAGNTAARVAGIVLAVLSAIVNLAFIAAYPVWSTVVIAVDIIVIYAIVVHGRELKSEAV
jgi:tetrahydromethanopterin S-methyltransferase subunit F